MFTVGIAKGILKCIAVGIAGSIPEKKIVYEIQKITQRIAEGISKTSLRNSNNDWRRNFRNISEGLADKISKPFAKLTRPRNFEAVYKEIFKGWFFEEIPKIIAV